MRRFVTVFLLAMIVLLPQYGQAQSGGDGSGVSSVTVYSDRAMVTRRVSVKLVSGDNVVVLEGLPRDLDPASVRVEGRGGMVLKDVKVSDRFLSDVHSEKLQELLKEKEEYTGRLNEYRDRVSEAESEKEFVRNIASSLTKPSEGDGSRELDPDKWIKMVDFYRNRLRSLNDELRAAKKLISDVNREIIRINREIDSLGHQRNKSVKEIRMILASDKPGEGILNVSYMVPGPTWIPDYTVQVDDRSNEVSLVYKAFVYQSTGEDWDNVDLSLSTAKPAVGGDVPDLSPWYLEWSDPDAYRTESRGFFAAAPAPKMAEIPEAVSGARKLEDLPDLKYAISELKTGLTSVVFSLPGKSTVASDNQKHSVTVAIFKLPADFSYTCVPKMSPFVYLQADVKNKSEYPFLPGETHIFLGGNFVAKSSLRLVSPGEKFKINLGIDEGFSVKRRLINKKKSSGGFLSRKITVDYEYSIEITNNKTESKKIEILDQIPLSTDKKIIVTPDKSLQVDEDGYVRWIRTVAPGESVKIPFGFSVEYPKDITIDNLE